MLFTLEALRAQEGDCLLLHWTNSSGHKKIALIDGGPGMVYENHLRPRLEEIADNLEIDQLELELAMVSHLDSDHIIGVKKLFRKLRKEIESQLPPDQRLIRVKRLWHNIFNDVLGDSIKEYYKKLPTAALAGVDGEPDPAIVNQLTAALKKRDGESPAEEAEHDAQAIALILAAHNDGRDLRIDYDYLLDKQQIALLNTPFQDDQGRPTLISTDNTPDPKTIQSVKFTVVGPRLPQLRALQKEFDKYIEENGLSAEAVLAAYADKSVKNLSSIVCIVEKGGKSILLTGDARGDYLLKGLKEGGHLNDDGKIKVDILKVPHHGSNRNVEPDFFEKILADTYIFSGNGKHGNPDRDTFEWLAKARGTTPITLVLTYTVEETDRERKRDMEHNGKQWNHQRDSLEACFKKLSDDGHKLTIIDGAPIKIDLGDEAVDW